MKHHLLYSRALKDLRGEEHLLQTNYSITNITVQNELKKNPAHSAV